MARPVKCRRIEFLPDVTYFKPAGIPLRDLQEVNLTLEEMEAIRLHDLEGLEQEEGAQKMNISRPTFQRVLSSARKKIAEALVTGKAIRIEGGNFELFHRRFRCKNDHVWEGTEAGGEKSALLCPVCNSSDVRAEETPVDLRGGGGGRWRRGRRV